MLGLAQCARIDVNLREYELLCGKGIVATKHEVQAVSCSCQSFWGVGLIVFVTTLGAIWLSLLDDKVYRCSHIITSSTERRSFWI